MAKKKLRLPKSLDPPSQLWVVIDTLTGNIIFAVDELPDMEDMYNNEAVYEYRLRKKLTRKSTTTY